MPSTSGSLRSRMMRAGASLASSTSAPCAGRRGLDDVAGVLQVGGDERRDRGLVLDDEDRLLSRHDPTTRGRTLIGSRSEDEALGLGGQWSTELGLELAVGTVERVHAGVLARNLGLAIEHHDPTSHRGDVDAGSARHDPIAAAEHAEPHALAAIEDGARPEPLLRELSPDDEGDVAISGVWSVTRSVPLVRRPSTEPRRSSITTPLPRSTDSRRRSARQRRQDRRARQGPLRTRTR